MSVAFSSIKKAWLLLSEKGSRFRLILSGILLSFSFALPMMFGWYITLLRFGYTETTRPAEYVWVYAIALATGLLVTVPAASMFFCYAWQTYSSARYGYVDREKKRGAYNYFRSLFSGIIIMARPIACFILFQLAYEGAFALSEVCVFGKMAIPMIVFLVPFSAAAAVISVLLLWLTRRAFLVPYYYARGFGIWRSVKMSRKKCARYPLVWWMFFLIFAAMSAISALSVGVLFILLALPLMMFTYFTIAEHMDSTQGKKLLEDEKNE